MNLYLPCYGRHINAARWDPLDIACVRQAARLLRQRPPNAERPLAVDLGSGHGTMALTLHDLGYRVIAVDLRMPSLVKQTLGSDAIERDMTRIGWARLPAPTICYSQRTLHYLPFDTAAQLLTTLGRRTGARVFVSLAGADSELARNYPHADRPPVSIILHILGCPQLPVRRPTGSGTVLPTGPAGRRPVFHQRAALSVHRSRRCPAD